jgi:hypothetical protein
MSDSVSASSQVLPDGQAEYEAALEQVMAEVNRLNELMLQDRADIERLKTEAWQLKAETRALLTGMGANL